MCPNQQHQGYIVFVKIHALHACQHHLAQLSEQLVVYFVDSNAVIIVCNQFDLDRLKDLLAGHLSDIVLIKSQLTEDDIRKLSDMEKGGVRSVICNRIAFGAREYLKNTENTPIRMQDIFQTSQVGAVNLLIHTGQIILND